MKINALMGRKAKEKGTHNKPHHPLPPAFFCRLSTNWLCIQFFSLILRLLFLQKLKKKNKYLWNGTFTCLVVVHQSIASRAVTVISTFIVMAGMTATSRVWCLTFINIYNKKIVLSNEISMSSYILTIVNDEVNDYRFT